jgi:NAD(P)-dependent dehydrogenase (short-subunit alcohol dehydrogenase family)
MAGKNWLITGAGRGFGRIWAEAALARGDKVAASVRKLSDIDDLRERHGDALLPLHLDVTDRSAVFDAVELAHSSFGRLDVVISNAGYGAMGAIEEISIEQARANFETNVFGTLHLLQAVLPHLRAQKTGHILPVTSGAGLVSLPTTGIYSATKHAVEAMGEALAQEVAPLGIKVTMIEPGAFRTDFLAGVTQPSNMSVYDPLRDELTAMLDHQSLGDPQATAKVILKLVDAENPPARIILGEILPLIRQVYEQRLQTWAAWDELAREAQGRS